MEKITPKSVNNNILQVLIGDMQMLQAAQPCNTSSHQGTDHPFHEWIQKTLEDKKIKNWKFDKISKT